MILQKFRLELLVIKNKRDGIVVMKIAEIEMSSGKMKGDILVCNRNFKLPCISVLHFYSNLIP